MPDRQHARWSANGGLLFVIELEFRCGTAQLVMPDLPHASTARMEVCVSLHSVLSSDFGVERLSDHAIPAPDRQHVQWSVD